jgi:hypothetical protein
MVDREVGAQLVASFVAIALFIAGLIVLSQQYGQQVNGAIELSPTGGLAAVGFIAVFIVLMPVFGYLVERREFDSK